MDHKVSGNLLSEAAELREDPLASLSANVYFRLKSFLATVNKSGFSQLPKTLGKWASMYNDLIM